MFEGLFHFITGWREITADPACRSAVADLLWQCEISPIREQRRGQTLCYRIPWHRYGEFAAAAERAGVCVDEAGAGGLPVILAFCRRRPGIPIGILVLLAWCFYSQHLIWRIEIDGCENIPEAQVEQILTEAGCGIGDFYPGIDFDRLHAVIKAENPDIAWLSVYMHGTTAEVQLRETRHPDDRSHPPDTYANIKAAEGGEIVSVKVFEGEAVVAPGDVVLPGELLISGVVNMKKEGESRTEYAAGEVYAMVAVPISVEVRCEREKKEFTGRERTEKSIKIFKKTINLFRNTGIPYTTYDTIDKMEEVCLFGRYRLPLTVYSVRYREYETLTERITPADAAAEAMRQLNAETEKAVENGEMLHRTVTVATAEDGTCRIDSVLYVLRNIAAAEEFTVRNPNGASSHENET